MKIAIYAFAVVLGLASVYTATAKPFRHSSSASAAFPIPLCDPNDPNSCGIDGY